MRAQRSRPSNRKEGFANVARWMALDNDNETFIYRKFDELAARNLLYLQSELLALESRLASLDEQDVKSDDIDWKDAVRTWEILDELHSSNNHEARVRMELILDIRAKIKEYHEALLLQNEIAKLRRPNKRVLNAFKTWFKQPFPALGGQAKTFLDNADDLVALNTTQETDYLSQCLRRHWPAQEELSRDGSTRIGRYNEKSISLAVAIISISIAAILLVGSITSLYFVNNDGAKLGMVAAFTAAFAASIGAMTNARRAEIFGATAAYAAVLVVFVSGDISNEPKLSR